MKRRKIRSTIVIAVAATVLAAGWLLYQRFCVFSPGVEPDRDLYPQRGIDISAHNGEIDFNRVAADDISFVYAKATEGTDFKDRRFTDNVKAARQAGIPVGAYHFFRFNTDGRLQAINLMHSVRGLDLDLPVAIDIEEHGNPPASDTEAVIGRLRRMIAQLERHGHTVVLYTNRDGYERFIRGHFDGYPLWLCTFSDIAPEIPWSIWQYSHRGRVDGIDGRVDLNVMHQPAAITLADTQ